MVHTSFGSVIFASILCIYSISFAMEQTDQSKETYTLSYLKNEQYRLRYENDDFGRQVIIDGGNVGDQAFIKENVQSIGQSYQISLQEGCNFDAYVPLGFTDTDKIRNFFMQKTFEQMQSYDAVYSFLGCSADFINNFESCLLLKACQKDTNLGACIKKYFLTWDKSAYIKDLKALNLLSNEENKFDVISQQILRLLMPTFCFLLSKKINYNLFLSIKKKEDAEKAINFLINKLISYTELPTHNILKELFNCEEYKKIFSRPYSSKFIYINIIGPLFKLFDGIKCISNNTAAPCIWVQVKDRASIHLKDSTDQLPIPTAEDIPNNNSTCIFVLQKMLYEDDNLNSLDASMIPLDEYLYYMKNFLCPLKLIDHHKINAIKVLCGPSLDKTLYTLRESFPAIKTVDFVDSDDVENAITDDNWQDCLRNIFYENVTEDNAYYGLTFEPVCCYFPKNIFEKIQNKKNVLKGLYDKNVQKDSIDCVIKSVYKAASVAFFLMMAWHLLVAPKNKHFLFKASLYGLYYYFLQFNKWKPFCYTAACHIPIVMLLACYGQWDALPNIFRLPHAKGFVGFATPLSFIFYFTNSLRFYRDSTKIIDNREMKNIIAHFDTYIKKTTNSDDVT